MHLIQMQNKLNNIIYLEKKNKNNYNKQKMKKMKNKNKHKNQKMKKNNQKIFVKKKLREVKIKKLIKIKIKILKKIKEDYNKNKIIQAENYDDDKE